MQRALKTRSFVWRVLIGIFQVVAQLALPILHIKRLEQLINRDILGNNRMKLVVIYFKLKFIWGSLLPKCATILGSWQRILLIFKST